MPSGAGSEIPTGRFAPSPTGPLHAGSLVAALGSWLDARAQGGRWLVRIEDVDTPRCQAGADQIILQQLDALGLRPDGPVWRQSGRADAYEHALKTLQDRGLAYPCACTRREIEAAHRSTGRPRTPDSELVYPGTCRGGLGGRQARAQRLLTSDAQGQDTTIVWVDQAHGPQSQVVTRDVGDFVLRRADGLWAYQLAVVVDDAAQAVTDVVRGEDLRDNTPRQILLQRLLGLPTPRYRHLPLVRDALGRKLSKQHGAPALDTSDRRAVLRALGEAARTLGLHDPALAGPHWTSGGASSVGDWLARAVTAWRDLR
ncbi:MAG: tRNA glutamyl-Q(34) synthetase GluQRS [Rubrivivax sp.]